MYATSSWFTILDSSSSASASTYPSAVTVTVSSSPNPTVPFATTFALSNSSLLMILDITPVAIELDSVLLGCLVGAAWTLW